MYVDRTEVVIFLLKYKHLQEFFLNVKDLTRRVTSEEPRKQFDAWSGIESSLQAKYNDIRTIVHNALCGKKATTTIKNIFD